MGFIYFETPCNWISTVNKKLSNMRVTLIPQVISTLGTVTKNLERWQEELEIGERIETIQTAAL